MQKTIIIGGGLAGLTAAYYLQKAGESYQLIEATNRVGGRVKTDTVDGYLLDRGFQVFLTAYPEARAILDYKALDLKAFDPGALLLRADGKTGYIGDPLRQISSLLPTVFSSAATLSDKFNILKTKTSVTSKSIEEIFASEEFDTATLLSKTYGFSNRIISEFLRPFYAGIFLENDLSTSRRMFDFVFKMFSEGDASVPALGMEEIPKQIAAHLDPSNIVTNKKVVAIEGKEVTLQDGTKLLADKIIVATEANGLAAQLTKVKTAHRSTTTIYFEAPINPFTRKTIALNGASSSIVNNMTVMTNVAPAYGKNGHLVSVSLKDGVEYSNITIHQAIKEELSAWFPSARKWKHIKSYQIKYALPDQTNITNEGLHVAGERVAIIGDHTLNGSINAAMKSGRLGAEWASSF